MTQYLFPQNKGAFKEVISTILSKNVVAKPSFQSSTIQPCSVARREIIEKNDVSEKRRRKPRIFITTTSQEYGHQRLRHCSNIMLISTWAADIETFIKNNASFAIIEKLP